MKSSRIFIAAAAVVGLAGVAAGCSFDTHDCTLGAGCPQDYSCNTSTGLCDRLEGRPDAGRRDADARRDGEPARDTTTTDTTEPPPPDATPEDVADTADPAGACVVDPFTATCQDDRYEPNQDIVDAERLVSGAVGCEQFDDTPEPFDEQRSATLCPGNDDWYTYQLFPCRNRSFIIEVTVTPAQSCDPTDYVLSINHGDSPFASCLDPANDSGSNWRCESLGGGAKKLSYIVEPDRDQPLRGNYVHVEPAFNNAQASVQFDYDIRARNQP